MKRRHRQKSHLDGPLQRRHQPRRGSWLAQMVITITIMSVLMTIASTSLFRMYRQEALMVEQTFQTSTWMRLSRDFRQDLHVADTVSQSEDGSRLVLTNADSRITWLVSGHDVKRVVQKSDSETELDQLPGEQYSFTGSAIRFSVETSDVVNPVASIEVSLPATPNGGIPPSKVAVATAGLDHRFLRQSDNMGEQP